MTGWRGPQGRLWNILFGLLFTFTIVPLLLGNNDEDSLIMGQVVLISCLVVFIILYAVGRWYILTDSWNMVFLDTSMEVKDAGTAIQEALERAFIPFEDPVTRPWSNALKPWFEWEVEIPDERRRICVMTGGLQGRVVFVGPVDQFNANEVERLKRPVEVALGFLRHYHDGIA